MLQGLPSPPRPLRVLTHGHRVSSVRRHFCKLSFNGRPTKALTQWTNWTNVLAMKTVNVHEAKTNFSSLFATVEDSSESFVICRNGEPVADLVPHKRANRINTHPALSKIKIGYDPVEPLSADEWPEAAR